MKESLRQMQMFGLEDESIPLKKGKQGEDRVLFLLLQKIVEQVLLYKQQLLEKLKPQLIDFAIVLCEKVIRQQLAHPETLAHMIEHFLGVEGAIDADRLIISLSPSDFTLLKEHRNFSFFQDPKLQFMTDTTLLSGDVRIETKDMMINATVLRQLQTMRGKILET